MFEVEDGFRIELFASEPLTTDPIAMEVDEDGRIYVVEMGSYPMDTSGVGRIRILMDTNGDGYPDHSEVFADGLKFPTGVMRWKTGILVTDPPNLIFMKDTTGEGIADVQRVVLTGFALSNPQHNVNTPLYGLDNWIYLANSGTISTHLLEEEFGDQGAEVHFPDRPQSPRLGRNADDRNVRLKPDTYELENLSASSQYGHTFDVWGRHFQVSNARRLFHEVVALRYLRRNPQLLVSSARHFVPDENARVFPITEDPEHQWLTEAGVFTSACGVTCYLGGTYPADYKNVMLIAEPQHNLVRVDQIIDAGTTFRAGNLLSEREFLASTDSWFRPVNFYIGPDGAVYVIDFYRQIIDHPEWLAPDVVRSGQLDNGSDRGRIYRIVPEESGPPTWTSDTRLSAATDEQLIEALKSRNIWWRRTAQRLLVDRRNEHAVPLLVRMARESPLAEARLHALWTLEGFGQLEPDVITSALSDREPGVRENAIKLAELHLSESPQLAKALVGMSEDPNAKVRFQLLLTLGNLDSDDAGEVRRELLLKDFEDEWTQIAALSSRAGGDLELYQTALQELADQRTDARQSYFRRLGALIAARRDIGDIRSVLRQVLSDTSDGTAWWRAASVEGLAEGLPGTEIGARQLRAEVDALTVSLFEDKADVRRAYVTLLEEVGLPPGEAGRAVLGRAADLAFSGRHEPELRADALQVISLGDPSRHLDMLAEAISPQEPPSVQIAAVWTLREIEGGDVADVLLDRWASMTSDVRAAAARILIAEPDRIRRLLDAVEEGLISPSTIDRRSSIRLMRHRDQRVRDRATALLGEGPGERAEVVNRYAASTPATGSWENGAYIFERSCSTCHQINGVDGVAFGPDLSTVRHWSREALLTKILDPNRSVAEGYEMWIVERGSGSTAVGILSAQMPASITLRSAEEEVTIPRSDIESMVASNATPMPVGLEQQIDETEMADLLEFLRHEKN